VRRGKTIRRKRLISLVLVAVASGAAAQSLGCATPEQRHRVLTFFFDGVPPLYPEEAEPATEEVPADEAPRLARVRPRRRPLSVHGPVAEKDCEQCHASDYSNQLTEPKEDLCWSCHDPEDFPGEVVHGPVAAGFCDGCHDPHRSAYPSLLVSAGGELCDTCHDQTGFANIDEHRSERGDDCQGCHDPHAADREYMLKRDAEPS
jgi:predicted CXXCH cytochrome family protein